MNEWEKWEGIMDTRKIEFSREKGDVYECKITNKKYGTFTKCMIIHETPKALLVSGIQESGRPSDMVYIYREHWIPKRYIKIGNIAGKIVFNFVPHRAWEEQGFYSIKRRTKK